MLKRRNVTKRIIATIFTLIAILTIVPISKVEAATGFDGKWAITNNVSMPVYSNEACTAKIGTVYANEGFSILYFYGPYGSNAYIEYSTSSGAKRGYVIVSGLTGANPPSIPNIPDYAGFVSGTYGTSGLGTNLKYYKIGNGTNVAFAVFEQHGWEDEWAYDGIELVKIANRVMSNLSSSGINGNWTLYVIPYANPDGITNGYTNNGPGRCTVTTGIDMNRCWPANFTPYYTSRNYTGNNALGAPEASQLKDFISNNIGNGEKIILDIHGWLNQTYGDSSIAQYFGNQFGFVHSSTYGSGYLETWGKSIGAKSCLVELPKPSSSQDILNRDFSGKVANAIKNMLNSTGSSIPEGGTEVNEKVKVIASGSLNVRGGPGTGYSIIASLAEGTIVTRIKRGVAIANGYTWDKIRLDNGTDGYVATNYLEEISNDEYTVDEKVFVNNATSSMHDSEYIKKREEQNQLWNSMLPEDKAIKNAEMTSNYNRLTQAVDDFRNYYDLGAEALGYFLSNQGGEHNLGDMRTLYLIPSQAEVEYLYLNRNIKTAEHFTTNQSSSFALKYEYDLKVGDYNLDMIDTLLASQAGDYLSTIKVDWFIAAHSFKMGNTSTVEKTGNHYKMYVNFNMSDYYDWDDGMFPFVINQNLTDPNSYILETHIRDLHLAGKAKNFESKGTIRVLVEWDSGQTAEQADVSILS